MRAKRTAQASIFEQFSDHDLGRELASMSAWLDAHHEVCDWVGADLGDAAVAATGRRGLPAEAVLRCGLLKQHRQLSYEELAFYLSDSMSFQAFARLPMGMSPSRATLARCIGAIAASTWERLNTALKTSVSKRIEPGRRIRVDSTVTESTIHPPSDSSLLADGLRTMVRLLERAARSSPDVRLHWHDHRRAGKKYARRIEYARGKEKKAKLYRTLIGYVECTLGYLEAACAQVCPTGQGAAWLAEATHYKALIERVISQTKQRVFEGIAVPATDKIVSVFEPHCDLIKKGNRAVQYGHKLNVVSGRSGLILDVVVETGNPADATRLLPMLDRHIAHYGQAPRQLAADGGYASTVNLAEAKARGVEDVAFHKKRGIAIEAMVKSRWVYRALRNFRAGIEANISCLKRAYGLDRCTWKGREHFDAYVWSSVFAYNLGLLAKLTEP